MEESSGLVESSGAFGIPKWMMKKGMRYEIDDFIVSPPSNEDGGFFHLRYGRNRSGRACPSSNDSANQEMSMTVEVRNGSTVITSLNSPEPLDSSNPSPALTISSGGLSATTTPSTTPEVFGEDKTVHPLFVLNLASKSTAESGEGIDSVKTDLRPIQDPSSRSPQVSLEENFKEISLLKADPSSLNESRTDRRRKISLVERFQAEERVKEILSLKADPSSLEESSKELERNIPRVEKDQGEESFQETSLLIPHPCSPTESSSEPKKKIFVDPSSVNESRTDERRKISVVGRFQGEEGFKEILSLKADSSSLEESSTESERKIFPVEKVQGEESFQETSLLTQDPCSPTESSSEPKRKISFVERVQAVPITPTEGSANLTPRSTPRSTPLTSPLVTPQTSPHAQRKVMGVVMERTSKSTVHSYFCTKPLLQGTQQQDSSTATDMSREAGQGSLSSSSMVRTSQIEEGIKAAQAVDPNMKPVMGKRRQRPKPSSLREMNFWAPTSM